MKTKKQILKNFVKALVDDYPLGDKNVVKIYEFYKKYIEQL